MVRCPNCGSTTWKSVVTGVFMEEDFWHSDTDTGRVGMDEHHTSESDETCASCGKDIFALADEFPGFSGDAVVDGFNGADWEGKDD